MKLLTHRKDASTAQVVSPLAFNGSHLSVETRSRPPTIARPSYLSPFAMHSRFALFSASAQASLRADSSEYVVETVPRTQTCSSRVRYGGGWGGSA